LKNLEFLSLERTNCKDISPLKDLSELKHLNLSNIRLDIDFKYLEKITKLSFLNVSICPYNTLKNTHLISGFYFLEHLNVGFSDFNTEHLALISNPEKMKFLDLACISQADKGNYQDKSKRLADISIIKVFKNLEELSIGQNNITDLSPLKYLENLESLSCHSNSITDLTPLSNLKKLIYLGCSDNQIEDLTPLANLNLKRLNIGNNFISDLSPLANTQTLTDISITRNKIYDMASIEALSGLKNLEMLLFFDNTLDPSLPVPAYLRKRNIDIGDPF
jgi:internalin A